MDRLEFLFGVVLILGVWSSAWADIDTVTAEVDPYPLETDDISGMCSLGCAVWWKLDASSCLSSQGDNVYDVSQIDGRVRTAWVEGVAGQGIGEYVTFVFPDSSEYFPMDSVNLNGFRIMNGYCKSQETWEQNSRVKILKVYHNGNPVCLIKLHDSMELQNAVFKTIWLKPKDRIKVEILDVYPGTKYTDTALSVLEPLGAH